MKEAEIWERHIEEAMDRRTGTEKATNKVAEVETVLITVEIHQ